MISLNLDWNDCNLNVSWTSHSHHICTVYQKSHITLLHALCTMQKCYFMFWCHFTYLRYDSYCMTRRSNSILELEGTHQTGSVCLLKLWRNLYSRRFKRPHRPVVSTDRSCALYDEMRKGSKVEYIISIEVVYTVNVEHFLDLWRKHLWIPTPAQTGAVVSTDLMLYDSLRNKSTTRWYYRCSKECLPRLLKMMSKQLL